MKIRKMMMLSAFSSVYMNAESGGESGGGGGFGGDNQGGDNQPDDNGANDADKFAGLRTKFSGDDGNIDIDRLLGSYQGMQQQNTQLSQSKAPESYEFTMPDGAGDYLGEIDNASPVFEQLSDWGRKHGLPQEAMQELVHSQYNREVESMQGHKSKVQEFEASMGKDWAVKKEGYQNQLAALTRNHQDAEAMNEVFSEMLTMPAGVTLIESMLSSNRDHNIGSANNGIPSKTITEGGLQELKSQEMTLRKAGKKAQADDIAKQYKADLQTYSSRRQ